MNILFTIAAVLKTIQDATPILGGLLPFLGFFDPLNLVDGFAILARLFG